LVNLVLDALGSASHDRRTSAGLTLGDLVRKLDGGVTDSSHSIIVSKVIPIFGGIISDPLSIPSKRQGVFVGLTEILSTSRVTDYGATITPLIRVGLGDGDQQVREAAVLAFDALQLVLGPKVFDEIVPHLLDALSSEQHEDSRAALDALTQLVSIKPTLLIPVLVPILIKEEPIPIVHIKTLQALLSNSTNSSSVTLLSLLQQQRKLVNILSALFNSYGSSDADQPEYNDAINDILKSISTNCAKDTNGVLIDMFMGFLFDMANSSIKQLSDDLDNNSLSRVTLAFFCIDSIYTNCSQHGFHNMNKYTIEWLNVTLSLLVESSTADMNMSFIPSTLTKLCASIQKPNIAKHAPIFQRTISQSYAQRNSARTKSQRQQTSSESNDTFVHGFTLPKILTPILAIYNYTLLESRTEEHQEKEAAIAGIIDLINYTNPTTLALYVTSGITGPLIRFLSERSNISSSASASTSSSGSTSIMSSSAANAAALEAAANAVRANVIYALSLLLEKTSKNMRPFLPQLQRTFVKFLVVPPASLSNPASSTFAGSISSGESTVKARCQLGLEKLVGLQPRLDPLVTELVNIIRTYLSYPSSALAKSSCVIAVNVLRSILTHVNSSGLTLSDASRLSIEQLFVFGSSDTSSASEEAGETATTTTTTGQRAANLLSLTSSSTSSSSISSPLSGDAHDTDSLQVAVTNILPVIFLSSSSSSSSASTKPTTTTTASGSAASSSLFKHLKLTTPDDLSSSNTSALTSKLLLNISVLSSLTKTSSTSSATSSNDELLTLIFCNLQLLFTTRYNNSEVVTSIISDDKQFSAFVKSLELFKLYFALKTPTANTAESANQPSSSLLLETTIKNVFLPSLALSSTTAITTSTSYNALFVQLVNVLKYLAKHTASTTSTPSNVLYDCLPTNLYYEIINSVFDFVRSHHIPLKFASERCLLYLLFLKSNTSTPNPADGAGNRVFDAFVAHCFADELTASSSASVAMGLKKKKKLVVDYYSRVLSKLSVSTEDPDYVDSD
ncbi:Translational activator gcn1, partial [Zancudomyces culisetae]